MRSSGVRPISPIAIGVRLERPAARVLGLAEVPAEAVAEIEGPALEHHVVAAGVRRRRKERDQVRRTHRRGEQLRGGAVAAAEHADAAVDVGQLRDPLDRVVAVGALVVRHGDAVGHVAAAGILHDDDEAGLGETVELAARLAGILGVRVRCSSAGRWPSPSGR